MKFSIQRDELLRPLQLAGGVVERRQTMPVLANVLLVQSGSNLSITGTDLEVEIVAKVELEGATGDAEITVPAKKFIDICRALPDGSNIQFSFDSQKVLIKGGSARFTLSTLPASDFPSVEESEKNVSFSCTQKALKETIDRTAFAMAQQDVRYYLNGMLWELDKNKLNVVATDGHRLALSSCEVESASGLGEAIQVILPRKGVLELARLLQDPEETVEISLGKNHLRAKTKNFVFTSKLVEGKFPNYQQVIPRNGDKRLVGNKAELKQAFGRTSILSNEKYRGVRLILEPGKLSLVANNPEQEEAEDHVAVSYEGGNLEVGFNVSYIMDVLNVIGGENVAITLSDANSSALIEEESASNAAYVVMPMRL